MRGFSASYVTYPSSVVSAEIKLTNETWSRDLLDNTSVAFIDLSNKIESAVHNRLGSVLGYVSTKVRSFRGSSVYADIAVTSNQSLSDTGDLETLLSSLVSSGLVGNLAVNSSYFQFYDEAYYIADTFVDYTSKGKVSNSSPGVYVIVTGYDVTATCSSRTPGVSQPKFNWTLGGRDMTSMQSSGRYVISRPNRSDNDPFKFVSSVRIKEILTTESGQLVCNVTAAGNTISQQVVLQVVAKLETTLNPSSSIVSPGSDVNLVCVRRAGYEVPWQAILYPAESAGGQVQVVNTTEKDEQANFTIRGVSSTVRYRCNISDSIATAVSNEATIFIPEPATRNCSEDEDWDKTPGGNTAHLSCPQGYADGGLQYRQCGKDGQWREPDTSQCVRQELEDLKTTIDQIGTGTTNENTKDVIEKLHRSTGGSRPLLSGDVIAVVDILDKVANFFVDTNQAPGEEEQENFVMIADNVLHASSGVWQDQTTKALSLVNAVDRMGKASSRMLNSSGSQRLITSNKIVLQVGRSNRSDIVFPTPSQTDNYPQWVTAASNSAFLSKDALNASLGEVGYSAVIYRNLSNVFSGQVNQTLELSINSPILALSLALDGDRLLKPVRLTFDHIMVNFSSASCQFLDFSASAKGIWSTKGCRVTKSHSTMTVCECDHLTNFAVLMSPYRPANEVANVLNVFSIVGCSISIFCLILTLAIYFIFWRYVKSDRSVLLVHMCVVLVLAYVTFLAGVNRVENEIVCTVVAGLLHYLWLVVFFLMLCEGIDIFITIVIIFPTKSALAWLLLTAYGVPVIIVGVSMGVTKSQGYGGTVFCWLSLEEGLFWAFVGPAVAALVANFVVIVIVIYTMLNSRVMIMKEKRERAKSVVKAICVMTPILGLSWIFGVMSVNDDTVVFQVLFVVFNSLQGLMIFILHCLLSKQVREGMQHKLRRYQTNSKGVDDSSSKYVTQKQTSESNMSSNDLDRKTGTVLRRQMRASDSVH
ncbi:adhesion G protein-coupled receptor B1-like [Littorina saxatilis]|uniref:adhesion G protein-coupled receptor B1-like n=1 Tax=Littorina saxatilis TaxID=31220 RepID=UPI0038B5B7DF